MVGAEAVDAVVAVEPVVVGSVFAAESAASTVTDCGGGVVVEPGSVAVDPALTRSIERSRTPSHTAATRSATDAKGSRNRRIRTRNGDLRLPLGSCLLRENRATATLSLLSPGIGSSCPAGEGVYAALVSCAGGGTR